MDKMVVTVFKAVALAIIFVVVWSVGFYLYRAYALNQKMEYIMTVISQDVSRNNYLTADSYDMVSNLLLGIQADMNGGSEFVQGFRINYAHACEDINKPSVSQPGYNYMLNTPANYGDIAVIELSVTINAVDLFYDTNADGAANELQIGADGVPLDFTYVSQVPCLRYISVT